MTPLKAKLREIIAAEGPISVERYMELCWQQRRVGLDGDRLVFTAHVDFQALGEAAASEGAREHGPLAQGEFVRQLGIGKHADTIEAATPTAQAAAIDAALARLAARDATGMGDLFKVMALAHPRLGELPGFYS